MKRELDTLMKLAQLEQMQNQPDPQQVAAQQMLMQMLDMNSRREGQDASAELERERMMQAAQQFQKELGFRREGQTAERAFADKRFEAEQFNAGAQRGLDLTKTMQENEKNLLGREALEFEKQNAKKKLVASLLQGQVLERSELAEALAQLGITPQAGAPRPQPVDMEARRKEVEAKSLNERLGLPKDYKPPLYDMFH